MPVRDIFFMAIFSLNILLACILIHQGLPSPFKEEKTVRLSNLHFDSRSGDSRIRAFKHYRETQDSPYKNVLISFRFRVYNITQWGNIFQTAPGNEGIRMELSQPSSLGLIIGCTEGERKGFKGFAVSKNIRTNRWYSAVISCDNERNLRVIIDGKASVSEHDNNYSCKISDIVLGRGFDEKRTFDGEVRDFSMHYSFGKESPSLSRSLMRKLRILYIGSLAMICGFVVMRETRNFREAKGEVC